MSKTPAKATPTPIPAFCPVVKPFFAITVGVGPATDLLLVALGFLPGFKESVSGLSGSDAAHLT